MKVLDRVLTFVENLIAGGALAASALLAIFAVILRNITGDVIFWSEEAIIYLVIFSSFFGAVVTLRHNEHVNVDILPVLLKGRARKIVVVLGAVLTTVYALIVVILSWQLIGEPFSRTTVTPALKAPLWAMELSIAVGMSLFLLRGIEMVVRAIRSRPEDMGKDTFAEEVAASGMDKDTLEASIEAIESGEGESLFDINQEHADRRARRDGPDHRVGPELRRRVDDATGPEPGTRERSADDAAGPGTSGDGDDLPPTGTKEEDR